MRVVYLVDRVLAPSRTKPKNLPHAVNLEPFVAVFKYYSKVPGNYHDFKGGQMCGPPRALDDKL